MHAVYRHTGRQSINMHKIIFFEKTTVGQSKNLSKIKQNRKIAYTLTGMNPKNTLEKSRPKGFTFAQTAEKALEVVDPRVNSHQKQRGNPNGQNTSVFSHRTAKGTLNRGVPWLVTSASKKPKTPKSPSLQALESWAEWQLHVFKVNV